MITYNRLREIVEGKLVNKTIAEPYEDLSEEIFGEGNAYSASEVRKRLYGMKRLFDVIDNESIVVGHVEDFLTTSAFDEEDKKELKLKKEQQKLRDQRREYTKVLAADSRSENLYDRLVEAASKLDSTVGRLKFNVRPAIVGKSEAVLVLGDWHYGLVTTNVYNRYNTNICKARIQRVVSQAVDRITLHQCHTLHVVVLGDLFHGAIHTGTRVASEELVCDQLMQVSEILAQTICELNQHVENTYVYVTYGNHGRTVQKKKDSVHRDNMERIVPWWLTQRLKDNKSIHIMEDNGTEFLFIDAAGHELCAAHGDQDSVKSSPRLLAALFYKRFGKNIEYVLLGDKHHHESFEELGVTAVVCGSLCGSDDYANGKRLYSTPSQLLLIVSPDVGIDAEYKLACE